MGIKDKDNFDLLDFDEIKKKNTIKNQLETKDSELFIVARTERINNIIFKDLPDDDCDIVDCMKAWTQIKVTAPDDYIIYLSDISVPKPQPIQLTQCGAPADYYHSDEDDDYSEIKSHPQNDDSIESEILNEDDKMQIFLYKMHPAKDCEAAVAKFNDLPLYRQLGLTEDPSSLNKHILYKSKEEIRAAVFIQAMFRMYLRFWKAKRSSKRRAKFFSTIKKPNLKSIIKVQKMFKRYLLRKKYKKIDKYEEQMKKDNMGWICSKGKKLNDNKYYNSLNIYTVTKVKGRDKSLILLFYAKDCRTSNVKIFSYNLPKYTSNEDSLIKISQFLIEYCLDLNDSSELYLDMELYDANKDVLSELMTVPLLEPKVQVKCHLVPKISTQNKCALKIQRLFKRFLLRKNKTKNGLIKDTIYNSVIKKPEGYYMVKLIAMRNSKIELKNAACFIYLEFKNKYGVNEDEQYREDFPIKNMKEYELSKENFDLIFNQYSRLQ